MLISKTCILFISDLDLVKEQAVWLDDTQKYKLPEIIVPRMKLPPPGR